MQELRSFCFTPNYSLLSCGIYHSSIIAEGNLYNFGDSQLGQLGLGFYCNSTTLPKLLQSATKIVSVSCGWLHTSFITEKGNLYSCGYNKYGRLGNNIYACDFDNDYNDNDDNYDYDSSVDEEYQNFQTTIMRYPQIVKFDERVAAVSCGTKHTAAITESGKLYLFGNNKYGQLCTGDTKCSNLPTQMVIDRLVTSVACGVSNTAFIDEAGNLYISHVTGVILTTLSDVVACACGSQRVACITKGGKLYLFEEVTSKPTLVSTGEAVVAVKFSDQAIVYLTVSGKMVVIGNLFRNNSELELLNFKEAVVEMSFHSNHGIFSTVSGKYYSFGYNSFGELGNGNKVSSFVPGEISIP